MKILSFLLPLTSLLIVAGCNGGGGNSDGKLEGSITIDGSSTVYPISEAVAEEYRAEQRDVKVTVGISGTGGGFQKFSRGEIDITNASRPIKESEENDAKAEGIEYIEIPVAFDGLAVIVNPENDWVDYFTVEELKRIWEPEAQKTIKRWNQIRPEWPDEEIHLYGPGVASGTFDYFTEAIVGKSGASRGDFTASEDDNVLVQGVSTDKYALGFFGIAYFEENSNKLKLIPVDDEDPTNGTGPITPTIETVKDGTYQPLARPIYIYVRKSAAERPEVNDFVNFYISIAGELSNEVGYIALPDDAYDLIAERFEKRITGSVFQGDIVGVNIADLLREDHGNQKEPEPAQSPADTIQ
ncbi:MAG: PstS family phosphate ABC transporter substrate-binding protein [Bacteroidia bacterium]